MTPALFAAGMVALCAALCVGAVRAWRVLEARPLRPLEAWVGRLAAVAVMALPLLADAGALPGPRAPSVGLPLTGGTMTGQVVFSGVTTDISTGTNEDLSLAPNGTGKIDLQSTVINSTQSYIDIQEAITTSKTDTCNGVAGTEGEVCVIPASGEGFMVSTATGNAYQRIWAKSSGSSLLQIVPNGTASYATVDLWVTGASVAAGQFIYTNSAAADADYADKVTIHGFSKLLAAIRYDDVAAGTDMFEFRDNGTATGAKQFAIDGNGAVRFSDKTSAHGATCNSANEGLLYYRSISASNKSGFCVCAETSSGVYGWKMGMTFGSSALTDGDC